MQQPKKSPYFCYTINKHGIGHVCNIGEALGNVLHCPYEIENGTNCKINPNPTEEWIRENEWSPERPAERTMGLLLLKTAIIDLVGKEAYEDLKDPNQSVDEWAKKWITHWLEEAKFPCLEEL